MRSRRWHDLRALLAPGENITRVQWTRRTAAATAACLALCAGSASAHEELRGDTTLDHTVVGGDPAQGFQFLRLGPGEPYAVRNDLTNPLGGREARRRSLAYFGQITDFQLSDEESPARVEFLDVDPSNTANAAYRPQEALIPHLTEWAIRQMNEFVRSPIAQGNGARASMLNAIMTGDLADNQQLNETEWVRTLLEGGIVDPNSGTSDLTGTNCPPGTPLDDPAKYTGVQDKDDTPTDDPHYYDPDDPSGDAAGWPKYPGLLDRAQQPFVAEGLKVPSYVLFGNHDGLVQGNQAATAPIERIATGCVKPLAASGLATAFDPGVILTPPASVMLIPPDQRRQFVDKLQFKKLFDTGRQVDDHGFGLVDKAEIDASQGAASYYDWSPAPGVRFVALDTLSEGGVTPQSSNGNVDEPQFNWFEAVLKEATARDEIVVVFAHHARSSLTADVPDEAAGECPPDDEHNHPANPGCDRDPRESNVKLGDDVAALMHKYPHAVAYVAGHSHENRIAPQKSEDGKAYWEIKSPAIADWPPQDRVIEVMDNCDGTLSVFGTILDTANRVNAPAAGSAAGGFDSETLASIARVITYNDPQLGPKSNAQGKAEADRNVELVIKDPRRLPPACAGANTVPTGGGGGGTVGPKPKIKLSVKPRRVRGGRRTCFRFRATSGGRVVPGATVGFAGRRVKTGKAGTKKICRRIYRSKRAYAKAKGFQTGRASVKVLRRKR
jgi:metallophosphoesterase (TIGR03767 family)